MTRRIFCKVLLVVVAIFGLLVLSGVLSAQGRRSENAFGRVRKAQERHTDRLMAMDGVEGTAIGFDQSGQLAVKVFTARPGVAGIDKKLDDDVPVDVVVTGKIYALPKGGKSGKRPKPNIEPLVKPPHWCERPVPIGVSTGHPDITAGTIGCRVKAGSSVYALSNNHVYANENRASIGDNVLQPGTYDGGVDPDDAIGTLADFEPIVFRRWARNEIDAAIALSDTDRLGNATPPDGYGRPNSITAAAYVNQLVKKYGRTTGETNGVITAINATVRVGYSRGTARFVKQIIVESGTEFIGGGDSGSLLVTDDDDVNPVGLLFAGTSDGLLAVANRIDLVLDRFGVTVDSEEAPPAGPPTADFVGEPTSGDAPLTVQFTDESSGSINEWSWDFGDGGNSIQQNPSHKYLGEGSYTVSLTVTCPGGSDDITKTDYITVTTPPPPPTLDSIAVTPETASIQVGSTQQYSATGTYSDASTADITTDVAWTSSKTEVATIDESGLATAKAEGTTNITAGLDGVEGSSTLTVTEAPSEVQVFSDSFESSADWTANWSQDSQGDWRRRTARKKEGNYAAEVDGRANDAQLISKDINLQGKTKATVTFWWYIERGLDTGEYLAFDVSADGGSWTEMASLNGNVFGAEDTWHYVEVKVTGIGSLKIRFRGTMSRSSEDAYVDVVEVVAW